MESIWLNRWILLSVAFYMSPIFLFAYFGYAIGLPVIILPILLILFFLVEYISGKRRLLRTVDSTKLNKEHEIHQQTKKIANRLEVPVPTVYLGELNGPNAFAVGRKGNGTIVISPELLNHLNKNEISGVLAHELSHLNSRDYIPVIVGQESAEILSTIMYSIVSAIPGTKSGENTFSEFISHWTYIFVLAVTMPVSRQREYIADKDAKEIGLGTELHNALIKINNAYASQDYAPPPRETSPLCINGINIDNLLKTHPPLEDRLERLRNTAG